MAMGGMSMITILMLLVFGIALFVVAGAVVWALFQAADRAAQRGEAGREETGQKNEGL